MSGARRLVVAPRLDHAALAIHVPGTHDLPHGSAWRSAVSWSRSRVHSFSLAISVLRAGSHSSRATILGVPVRLGVICLHQIDARGGGFRHYLGARDVPNWNARGRIAQLVPAGPLGVAHRRVGLGERRLLVLILRASSAIRS